MIKSPTMQIYTINIDAAPLFPVVERVLLKAGFQRANLHTNGLFTASSIKSCLYGKVYGTIREGDTFLIDALIERGFAVHIHEDQDVFVPQHLRERADFALCASHQCKLGEIVPEPQTPAYMDITVSATDSIAVGRFKSFGDHDRTQHYFERSRRHIEEWQSMPGDRFFHILQSHYHDFVYYLHNHMDNPGAEMDRVGRCVADWLEHWNFDAPDSVFWIFADHGDAVSRLTPPSDYLRWCFYKDTTRDALAISKSIVSGIDLFPTVLKKIGCVQVGAGNDCVSFDTELDRNRIYQSADLRLWDENRPHRHKDAPLPTIDNPSMADGLLMNVTAMRILDWDRDGLPLMLMQVTYYRHTRQYYYLTYPFDHEDPVYYRHYFEHQPPVFNEVLDLRAERPLRDCAIALAESLVQTFPWIENKDYLAALDAGTLPRWFIP